MELEMFFVMMVLIFNYVKLSLFKMQVKEANIALGGD